MVLQGQWARSWLALWWENKGVTSRLFQTPPPNLFLRLVVLVYVL